MNPLVTSLAYRLAPYVPNSLVNLYVRYQIQKALRLRILFVSYLYRWKLTLKMHQSLIKIADVSIDRDGKEKEFSRNTERPIIFGMIGLPQTGKSTIAKAFANGVGGVVIESNALRSHLHKKKTPVFPYVNEVAYSMAEEAIEFGFNPVLDSDFANPIKRQMLEAFASGLGAEVKYIHVTCHKDL